MFIKGGFGLPLSLLEGCPVCQFARVMVLVVGDHYASKVALACFLASHWVAHVAGVGVLIAFVYLVSLVATLFMAFSSR